MSYYNRPPAWFFMEPSPRPRRRKHGRRDYIDPLDELDFWEDRIKKLREKFKEEKKKDEKKPPSAGEAVMIFIQQLAVMTFIGLPVGLVALKFYRELFEYALK